MSCDGGHLGFLIDKKKNINFLEGHIRNISIPLVFSKRRRFLKFHQIRQYNWSLQLCWVKYKIIESTLENLAKTDT
jgi:hypothetical protein